MKRMYSSKGFSIKAATLAFMFIWNMLGALIIVPSLATFLLQPKSADKR